MATPLEGDAEYCAYVRYNFSPSAPDRSQCH